MWPMPRELTPCWRAPQIPRAITGEVPMKALWAAACMLGIMGCVGDVETAEDVTESASPMGRCSRPCKDGHDYLFRYCNNVGLVPAGLRATCEKYAKDALRECDNTPPDFQCYSACGNLEAFDQFCRENHPTGGCWNASVNAHGKC